MPRCRSSAQTLVEEACPGAKLRHYGGVVSRVEAGFVPVWPVGHCRDWAWREPPEIQVPSPCSADPPWCAEQGHRGRVMVGPEPFRARASGSTCWVRVHCAPFHVKHDIREARGALETTVPECVRGLRAGHPVIPTESSSSRHRLGLPETNASHSNERVLPGSCAGS